jgi:hypothetical protein
MIPLSTKGRKEGFGGSASHCAVHRAQLGEVRHAHGGRSWSRIDPTEGTELSMTGRQRICQRIACRCEAVQRGPHVGAYGVRMGRAVVLGRWGGMGILDPGMVSFFFYSFLFFYFPISFLSISNPKFEFKFHKRIYTHFKYSF